MWSFGWFLIKLDGLDLSWKSSSHKVLNTQKSRPTFVAFDPLTFHPVDQFWWFKRHKSDFYMCSWVCNVLVGLWPYLGCLNAFRSQIAIRLYYTLYSTTKGALDHPLKSIFFKFFCIFTIFWVNVIGKSGGRLNFPKSWHLTHPRLPRLFLMPTYGGI